MSVFSIYRPDGISLLEGYQERKKFNWEGTCYRSIMGVSTLQLKIELKSAIDIPVGSFIDYGGHRYTLYYPHSITKLHTKSFEYHLLFHGEEEELKLFKLKDVSGGKPYRLKFFLTAKPIDFLRVIVDTLNLSSSGWTVGNCIEASEKTIAFNHENCFAVLHRVAQEFDSEWKIEGKQISLGKVTHMADTPLAMQYGYGNGFRSGVGRRNDGDSQPIGRLYVEGGKRNIDRSKYGSSTLLLPKNATLIYEGKTYRTDADGMSITCDGNNHPAEDSYDGSGVYPMREGTVSEVAQVVEGGSTFYDIKDNSIPASLNFNDYRIKGEKATIVFQCGALAGREFDIVQTEENLTGYIHEERRFKLIPEELDGFEMPGGTFIPAVGDKYALFNISLPNEYLSNASQKMFKEAVKYFHDHSHPTFMFDGEVDPIWARQNWLEVGGMFVPGGHILFSDPQFHPEGSVIRIIAVKTPIGEPYQPELTLSNAPLSGSFASTLGKLEAEPVLAEERERGLRQYTKRYWQDAKESQNMLLQAMGALGDEFTSTLSPVALQTMQVLVGSAALQYRFVTSKAAPATANHLITWNKVGASLDVQAGIIQHRTLEIDTITFNRMPSDFRYWDLPRYKSPALTNQLTPYYLYAKVEKNGTAGAFELDDKARPFESASHFNLLVGLLSSEREGMRSFAPMYSYSELTPDGLTTRLIKSLDGSTYFDLERGEIGGNILFRGGSLEEWAEKTDNAVAKSGYQIHSPFTEVFLVGQNDVGYGTCECNPKLYQYGEEVPLDISKVRVYRKGWTRDNKMLETGEDPFELTPRILNNLRYFIDDSYIDTLPLYGVRLDVVYAEEWISLNEPPYSQPVNILATNSYTYYHVKDGKNGADGQDGQDAHTLLFAISIDANVRNGEVSDIWFPKLTVMYDGSEITDYEMVSVESKYNENNWSEENWNATWQCFELDIINTGYTNGVRLDVRVHYRGLTATNSVFIPNTKDGYDGKDGENGVSIVRVDGEFAKNNNSTKAPSAGWQTTSPSITGNEQLWTRTKTIYSSGNPTYTNAINITPKQGESGRSVSSITEEFAINNTKSEQPNTGWSTSQPAWEQGKYIWSRVKIEYSNPYGIEYTGYAVSSEWEAVNAIQIGGRNLNAYSNLTTGGFFNQQNNYELAVHDLHSYSDYIPCEANAPYTISSSVAFRNFRFVFYDANKVLIEGNIITVNSKIKTYTSPSNAVYFRYSLQNIDKTIKIERGNKATDWSEAPEDIEARRKESEERLQTAINQQKYITRAIRDGSTNIHGGLVLTNMIAVKDTPHGDEVISKEEVFSGFSMNGQDLPSADMESKYQLGVNDVTPPTGTWVVTPTNPTSARPVLWAKLFIGYQDDEYYSSEVKIPVAYYYQDNPVVSVTPQLHFSDDGTWQPMNWFASNLSMGGYVRGRAVVKYTKPIEGNVVGYMSALGGDMPFIGAGVQNFRGKGGAPESRMVEIWPNGRFKFADLRYNPHNDELEWINDGEPYMTHGGTPLSIAQLQAQAGETVRTIATFSVNSSGVHTLPNSVLTLTKEGGEFKFSTRVVATVMIAAGSFMGTIYDDFGVKADCTVSLYLRRTHGSQVSHYTLGTSVIATASVQVHQRSRDDDRFDVEFYWGSTSSSADVTIEDRLTNLPVGSYDLCLSLVNSVNDFADVSGSVQITNLREVMYDSPNINYIRYTSRGMMAYYGISKHFVIDKDDPKTFVTLKGATDLPGILAGGRCDSYGTVNYQWGRYADAQGYTKARVEKIAYGKYKVHHSIGHTRYTPQVTVENVGSLASSNFTDVRETYFVVMIYGTNGLRDAAFSYNCVGENA